MENEITLQNCAGSNNLQQGVESIIDDQEFDIPPVEDPPTLESILNAPDSEELIQEQNFLPDTVSLTQSDYCEVASISSQDSSTSVSVQQFSKAKPQKEKEIADKHGVVFRHVKLKSISSQLLSVADKVNAGLPTALAVSSLIAVGTSHGLVLVFDPKQVLRWCLGSTAVGAQYGAVSALSFNVDCTRLLCGFARGQISMWNLVNGKLLRTVVDAHPPGTAILHVKFTDDRTIAVTSDSGGSVFQLEFKRLMGVRTCESHCLFSGSRGEACIVEPLCTQQAVPEHPMKDVAVLAMASLSKVLVVAIKPYLKVHFVHPLLGDSATLPLLSWQYVVIQVSASNRIIDPVLAFARDRTVYFAQVVCQGVDNIKVSLLQKFDLPYKLLAMTWINSRTMVLIDTTEKGHLIDVKTKEEIQVLDLADVQLAYSTSFYKSLATGGNVSRALAYAGERACYQSVVTFNNQLVLLGTRGVHVLTLRTWSERINALVKHQKYQQAIELGLAFYKGEAKAAVGLSWNPGKRMSTVDEMMKNILSQYVDFSLTSLCPSWGRIEDLRNYYDDIVKSCVRYCIPTNNFDFLFSYIYDRLSQEQVAKEIFLESLLPFIADESLNYVPPIVMQSFVEHFESKSMLCDIETCIFHLDITSFDVHQVVSLCWSHSLYDALIHIYNKGMGDYITPLIELIGRLTNFVGKQMTHEQVQLGNKVLVYISCCLSGQGYPFGEIPEEKINPVREQVLLCITSLHTTSNSSDEPIYPYLRTLILFNTGEFFNVLSLAFQHSHFQGKEKQRVVDILLLLMVENVGFTPPQVGMLFVFLARQMSQANNEISVQSLLFEQVIESLCASDMSDMSRHEERQQIMLDLLKAGVLERFQEDQSREMRLVSMAEAAAFFQVVEVLHIKHRRFNLALSSYWRDVTRKNEIFKFIHSILNDTSVTLKEKESLKKEVWENLEKLVNINPGRTAELVLGVFETDISTVVDRLVSKEEVLFLFLKGAFKYLDKILKEERFEYKKPINVEALIYEKYLELMCKFQELQTNIIVFLKDHPVYRVDIALGTSKHFGKKEVTCFLLEKSGNYSDAFLLNVEMVAAELEKNCCKSSEVMISKSLEFLQRNSKLMTTEQAHKSWFELMDLILSKHSYMKNKNLIASGDNDKNDENMTVEWLKKMTSQVITAGIPYLSPGLILQKIISSPAYSSGRFFELRDLIINMVETCDYEQVLMKTCSNMVEKDLHDQMNVMFSVSGKASFLKMSNLCNICSKEMALLSIGSSSEIGLIACFQCGHSYHQTCISSMSSIEKDISNKIKCPLCSKGNKSLFLVKSSSSSEVDGKHSFDVLCSRSDEELSLKSFFQLQKTSSYLTTLSELQKNSSMPKQNRHNFFQSEEWLSQKLAAPSVV